MIDILDTKPICGRSKPYIPRYLHLGGDSVLFYVQCDRGNDKNHLALIDVKNNKLLNTRPGYFIEDFKYINGRLLLVKRGNLGKKGYGLMVQEVNFKTLETVDVINTDKFFPDGIKLLEDIPLYPDVDFIPELNLIIGTISNQKEKIRKVYIIDANTEKIKTIDDYVFQHQPGTRHPYKFFDLKGVYFISECKFYKTIDFKTLKLSEDIKYDPDEIKKAENPSGIVNTLNTPYQVAYTVEKGNDSLPLIYYGSVFPYFSTNVNVKETHADTINFFAGNLNSLAIVLKKGNTQYEYLVHKKLKEWNRRSYQKLFYLPSEKKYLCRDSVNPGEVKAIDASNLVYDKSRTNSFINDYILKSIKGFKEELRPNVEPVELVRYENTSRAAKDYRKVKSLKYGPDYFSVAYVYDDFIEFADDANIKTYAIPFTDCSSAFLIGKDSLVLAGSTNMVLISISKKEILMGIDLNKINSTYTPFNLTLSGAGNYLSVHNNMLNYAALIQLFPFKVLDNLPVTDHVKTIIASGDGNTILIEYRNVARYHQVLKYDIKSGETKIIDTEIPISAFTDDLSYFSTLATSKGYRVFNSAGESKYFTLYDAGAYNRMFKINDDKLLIDKGNILSWSEELVYTPNTNKEGFRFTSTGYDPKTRTVTSNDQYKYRETMQYLLTTDFKGIEDYSSKGKPVIKYITTDEAIEIEEWEKREAKEKIKAEKALQEKLEKQQEEQNNINAANMCDACNGNPINKSHNCAYGRCRNGYVYSEANTQRYDDRGYLIYKTTKTTEKCYLCKGTGYWHCEKCEGSGLARKKKKK